MTKPLQLRAFCPGPWRVEADPELKGLHPLHDSRYIVRGGEDDGSYTRICKMTDLQHQAGTAALIAAAPEMRAALVKIAKICEGTAGDRSTWKSRAGYYTLASIANTAISCVGVPADEELEAGTCADCGEDREDEAHTCSRTRWNTDATLLINILSDEDA